jgi:hypothetical protein
MPSNKNQDPTKKIVNAQSIIIKKPQKPINKNKILVLSGGGMSQTYFAIGAIKCLIDNHLFDYDVITAVSGGTIVLLFLEACYVFGYTKEPNWYEKYVRKTLYRLTDLNMLQGLLHSKLNFTEFNDLIYKVAPDFNKKQTALYPKIIFEYNYFDVATRTISNDHTDIFEPSKNVRLDGWNFIQTARCCLPFTNFNNKKTYDAGTLENVYLNSSINKYDPKEITIINIEQMLYYEKYKQPSYTEATLGSIFNLINASNREIMNITQNAFKNDKVNYCSISNSLQISKDKYHKNLFSNYTDGESDTLHVYYLGIVFKNTDMCKILENEGYIQMYHELKNNGHKKLKFHIPNKDVYNSNVSKIYEDFKTQNIPLQIIKDFFNYSVPV